VKDRKIISENNIPVAATMSWSGDVVLCFRDGTILPGKSDRRFHPEYYQKRKDWPCNPETGDPLPIWTGKQKAKTKGFFNKILNRIDENVSI
jgi:hypothetical protein